jgi:hypothetical protein
VNKVGKFQFQLVHFPEFHLNFQEMEKDLPLLRSDIGPADVAADREESIKAMFNNYDNIYSRILSDISIKFRDRDHADAKFAYMLGGVNKKTGVKTSIEEGARTWSFLRQGKTWKIVNFYVD